MGEPSMRSWSPIGRGRAYKSNKSRWKAGFSTADPRFADSPSRNRNRRSELAREEPLRTRSTTDASVNRLEIETEAILRQFPGGTVQRQVEVLGKKVDLLWILRPHFLAETKIAVECKDWKSPLSRETCAKVLSDYYPLIHEHVI